MPDHVFDLAVLIVAAGQGVRSGGDVPKQYADLAGTPIIARAFDAFGKLPVFIVIGEGQEALLGAALGERRPQGVAIGGATRQLSVLNGLAAIEARGGAARVLIHDAARPMLPPRVRDDLIAALDEHEGAIPVLPIADTLVRSDAEDGDLAGEPVDRSGVFRVQTPQAFRMAALQSALAGRANDDATDEAQLVRAAGHAVALVKGDTLLDKITLPGDIARMEGMIGRVALPGWRTAVATGFDVHRLQAGDGIWLGGVRIDCAWRLEGHSDADVLLHAITDALLGTIGAGDIGLHFPPSDPQWRGAASDRFLAHAAMLVGAAGGRIEHVDATVICERPKIGPHREAIRERIAGILGCAHDQVSIKATTTERLGFAGRGEGIAVQASATVLLPRQPTSPLPPQG